METKISLNDKIFVAGGSGMVGSSILRKLKNNGYKNIFYPNRKELNLFNYQLVKNWFAKNKPHIVIIAAAKVGGIYANSKYPGDFLIENLKIQTNIIECSWEVGVKRLLFLGSSCIYPKLSRQPIKEEFLLESSLEKTNESYAVAKIAGLKLCESLRKQYGFDAISLMPTNLYGPKDNYHSENSHVVASLIKKFITAKFKNLPEVTCWGTGSVLREFLHVNDLAEAVIFCMREWHPSNINAPKDSQGEVLNHLNVGTGKEISIIKLAEMISKIVDYKGKILWDKTKPDGTPRKLLDVSRINNLGWKASIDLETGLRETIKGLDLKKFNSF